MKFSPGKAIGIFRVDGKTSLRGLQGCIENVFCVNVSLGLIYGELRRIAEIAEKINLKVSSLVNLSRCVMDEVWIKVAKRRYHLRKKCQQLLLKLDLFLNEKGKIEIKGRKGDTEG